MCEVLVDSAQGIAQKGLLRGFDEHLGCARST
jgi:hypothetical protein